MGQGVSLIGTWMQNVAASWLVYRMTHSAFLLGFVGFSAQTPIFLLGPFAGVLSDRLDRHRILVVTQTLAMIQAAILAILTLSGVIAIWQIVILSVFLGIINAFDGPARQSFVVDMVARKEDLGNAIALNSFIVNGARFIGPSIAGMIIGIWNEGGCFLINALSFPGIIAALLAMDIHRGRLHRRPSHILHELKMGIEYVFSFPPIKYILLLLALVSLVGMPYATLMPIFAKEIHHGGPSTLGFLVTATGMGALSGAIYLASRKTVLGLGRIIAVSSGLFGLAVIAFSFSRFLWLSIPLLVVAGFGIIVQMASSNTLIQTIVDDDKRGRVMSLFIMAFIGVAPFGSLLAGSLASAIGAPYTLIIGGLLCIAGSAVFAVRLPYLRVLLRPIYAKKGILPPVVGEN